MPIQTTPTPSQAIDYLVSTADIPVRTMSKALYKLLNSCARVAYRTYGSLQDGTLGGYYDPEYDGDRLYVQKHLHWRPSYAETIPQSRQLSQKTTLRYDDPLADISALIGPCLSD